MAKQTEIELLQAALDQAQLKSMLAKSSLEVGVLTDSEKEVTKATITIEDAKIIQIKQQISDLEEAEESAKDARHWAKDKKLVEQAIRENHMGYLIPDKSIIYCRNVGRSQSNASFFYVGDGAQKPVRLFKKLCKSQLKGAEDFRIIDLLEQMGRSYLSSTSSYNYDKWNSDEIYNQAKIIMNFWTQPNFKEAESYHKDFDVLMHCVGGGKQENIDHLETWVAYKFLYPERVANTPNIDLGGQPGGNGKGRFVKLTETVFTPVCVIEAAAKEIKEGFNANWANAVVIHYDEPDQKELPNSKIKNATGGESQRIEKKGIDATMADRNFSFIFTSNNDDGVVQLSGNKTGEDRRYSVITTNINLHDYVQKTMKLSTVDASDRVNDIAQLVKNREEVSKWLAHIIMKHQVDTMPILRPLHGQDYDNLFQGQKKPADKAFDAIMPVFISEGFISKDLLHELVQVLTDNTKWTSTGVKNAFFSYLKNKGLNPTTQEKVRVDYLWNNNSVELNVKDRPQITVICLTDNSGNIVRPSDTFEYSLVSQKKYMKGIEMSKSMIALVSK